MSNVECSAGIIKSFEGFPKLISDSSDLAVHKGGFSRFLGRNGSEHDAVVDGRFNRVGGDRRGDGWDTGLTYGGS